MERESFGSRLGFILVSAGCAIGIGNVWKFPYICGQYGGAAFILIYLFFLVVLGLPILTSEFAVGRNSRKSVALGFGALQPENGKWHHLKYIGIIGCYMLMMFYTTVAGWLLNYCFKSLSGELSGVSTEQIDSVFSNMLGDAGSMTFWTVLICVLGFIVCAFGLKNGLERVTKVMMSALIVIMLVLAVHSVTLSGAGEGVKFYLVPDFKRMVEMGVGNVVFAALSQAFFTLSIGVGAMQIFGSYLDKKRSLLGEAVNITALDTFVALTAGFIVIPSCFSYGIEPSQGPGLIFRTLPNIFSNMPGGRIWGFFFFLFLTFAAFSTVTAVFENLIMFHMELHNTTRQKSVFFCAALVIVLSLPCVFGFNLLSEVQLLGEGSTIMDVEDFIVSNNLLPLGSLAYILFCTKKNGWGWENFLRETNEGKGMKLSAVTKLYFSYGIPVIVIAIYLKGYYDKFAGESTAIFAGWMIFALLFLSFVIWCSTAKTKSKTKA